ncbi:hypothetical protein [Acetobacter aceti]|nr:hypothetical protein [Acetobacter aceti]
MPVIEMQAFTDWQAGVHSRISSLRLRYIASFHAETGRSGLS